MILIDVAQRGDLVLATERAHVVPAHAAQADRRDLQSAVGRQRAARRRQRRGGNGGAGVEEAASRNVRHRHQNNSSSRERNWLIALLWLAASMMRMMASVC